LSFTKKNEWILTRRQSSIVRLAPDNHGHEYRRSKFVKN